MPSPSSPLEYRPTPHLIFIILFIIFPLIYLCSRLLLTACLVLGLVLKSMFSRVLRFLYEDELTPVTRIPRCAPRISPARNVPTVNAVQDVEIMSAETSATDDDDDEELVDESDEEPELMATTTQKLTDGIIKPKPETSTGIRADQSEPLKIDVRTGGLHDSENDSGNEEDPSAMSATSTATSATNQTPDLPEMENLQTHDDAVETVIEVRHRSNAARTNDDDDGGEKRDPECGH